MIEAAPKPFKFKISDDELLAKINQDIEDAEAHFCTYVRDAVIERYRVVRADKTRYEELFPRLSKRSTVTTSDAEDTIEWILPSLVRIFLGGSDVVSVTGRTAEDHPEAMQALIQHQVMTKNPGFQILTQWFRDALEAGLGIVLNEWDRDFYTQTEEVEIGAEELLMLDPTGVLDIAELGNGTYWLKRKLVRMIRNQPRLRNIPASEYIYIPETEENGQFPFEARRYYISESELRRLENLKQIKNVDKAIATSTGPNVEMDELDEVIRPYRQDSLFGEGWGEGRDQSRKKHLAYRCYAKYDVNGDGILEDIVVLKVGNVIVGKAPNTLGRSGFHTITALPASYSAWGRGIADLVQDLQDLRTALLRQIIINVSGNNDRKAIVDASQSQALNDIKNDLSVIRMNTQNGQPIKNLIDFFPHSPLSPETFPFWETLQGMIESRTGVTRYNQGIDANSLNKTATGITQIMSAAQQRIELMARYIAETGVSPLFRHLVAMNQRFIDQEQVIRLANKPLVIRPDDLDGMYDVEVSSGLGTGTKQQNIQNLMLLISQIIPQLMQFGVADPMNLYNAAAKLVEEMGYKNSSDFVSGPNPAMMAGVPPGVVPPGVVPPQNAGPGQPAPSVPPVPSSATPGQPAPSVPPVPSNATPGGQPA